MYQYLNSNLEGRNLGTLYVQYTVHCTVYKVKCTVTVHLCSTALCVDMPYINSIKYLVDSRARV